jgi:hypothetical protein
MGIGAVGALVGAAVGLLALGELLHERFGV